MPSSISVVVPTLNACRTIEPLLDCLLQQTLVPDEIIVIDSGSDDETVRMAASRPRTKVVSIERDAFDHGGTRDEALGLSRGDFVLFLTQDAIPVDRRYVENIVAPFADEHVAAVCGRQIAYPDARASERFVRAFNYPDKSFFWDRNDIPRLGIKTFFLSDVCSAYRRSAYEDAGGFDAPVETNEDMLMAAKLLDEGHSIAYCADAAVFHSHDYTLRQEFARYRLIARTLKRYQDRLHHVKMGGEGLRLVRYVLKNLASEQKFPECAWFCASCAARLIGHWIGSQEARRFTAQASAKTGSRDVRKGA